MASSRPLSRANGNVAPPVAFVSTWVALILPSRMSSPMPPGNTHALFGSGQLRIGRRDCRWAGRRSGCRSLRPAFLAFRHPQFGGIHCHARGLSGDGDLAERPLAAAVPLVDSVKHAGAHDRAGTDLLKGPRQYVLVARGTALEIPDARSRRPVQSGPHLWPPYPQSPSASGRYRALRNLRVAGDGDRHEDWAGLAPNCES